MVDFRAFRGLRPAPGRAPEVACVPYDVVDTAEATARVQGRPHSLLRVTRPDVELPPGSSLYSAEAYATAQRNFAALIEAGALCEDAAPAFYAYALQMGEHTQLGVVGTGSAEDYRAGRIKKLEHTRPGKEDDRKRHIEAVRAHLGPVFATYRADATVEVALRSVVDGQAPEVDFVADEVRHRIWPIADEGLIAQIQSAFAGMDAIYIADGHHRSAAAARVGEGASSEEARGRFLIVCFPDDQLQILPYNRVVRDLNGRSPESLLAELAQGFVVNRLTAAAAPNVPHTFTMFLAGDWYHLGLRPEAAPDWADPVARLDVSILQDTVLAPMLGIGDPRTDERIGFVGGIRGLEELGRRAGSEGVAFALYATSLSELMDIADAGEVMPPKSTWFEPKLRTGLVISRY